MADDYNRRRGDQWRELVSLSLRAELGTSHAIAVRPVVRKLSEAFSDEWPTGAGDIFGVPGWTITTTAARRMDLSGPMDELERARLRDGNRLGALVKHRLNHPTPEAYVVLSFGTLIEILKESA